LEGLVGHFGNQGMRLDRLPQRSPRKQSVRATNVKRGFIFLTIV
jgi:hypothetical protein